MSWSSERISYIGTISTATGNIWVTSRTHMNFV